MNEYLLKSYNLLYDELVRWFEIAVKMLPNIVVALVVFSFFFAIAKYSKNLTERIIGRISDNPAVTRLLASLLNFTIVFAGIFVALGILNLDKTVTSLLAGAGVIGLVLGFAFQELSANFISGIFIAFRKPFGIEDVIETRDYLGIVKRVNLRATVIRTFYGQDVHIPNKILMTEPVVNYTDDPRRLVELEVGVSYSDDLELVEKIASEAVREITGSSYHDETKIYFRGFGDSSINFVVRYWINYPGDENYYRSTHDVVKKIKKAFDANNITIPFPIRTIDLGIKPTESLIQNLAPRTRLSDNKDAVN